MSKSVFDGNVRIQGGSGNVTLGGYLPAFKVLLIGSSCSASLPSGMEGSVVTFSPNRGKEAVAAIQVSIGSGTYRDPIRLISGLIRIYWDGDKAVVDKGHFEPRTDCLGQVSDSGDLIVTTQGQRFATCHERKVGRGEEVFEKRNQYLKVGIRIIDANRANLLCQYLVGQATFEELEAVASSDLRTAEQIRIRKLEEEIGHLNARSKAEESLVSKVECLTIRNSYLESELAKITEQLSKARSEKNELRKKYADAWERVMLLQNQLDRTLGARWRRFWDKIFIRRRFEG